MCVLEGLGVGHGRRRHVVGGGDQWLARGGSEAVRNLADCLPVFLQVEDTAEVCTTIQSTGSAVAKYTRSGENVGFSMKKGDLASETRDRRA